MEEWNSLLNLDNFDIRGSMHVTRYQATPVDQLTIQLQVHLHYNKVYIRQAR